MEPLATVVAKAATKETVDSLKKESEEFLKALYGEPAKALGGLVADKINKRRHSNLIKIIVDAKRKLAEAGVSPKEVPLSIIHPALEAASLEEEPELQKIWANDSHTLRNPRRRGRNRRLEFGIHHRGDKTTRFTSSFAISPNTSHCHGYFLFHRPFRYFC